MILVCLCVCRVHFLGVVGAKPELMLWMERLKPEPYGGLVDVPRAFGLESVV